MEIKKSRKADLENRRGLFLEIGLVLSLVVVVVAFSCTQKDREIEQIDTSRAVEEDVLVEVTREDQKPPEELPKRLELNLQNDALQIIENDSKADSNIDFTEFGAETEITIAPPKKEEIIEDEIFVIVEKPATFLGGGIDKFRIWVQERLDYPAIAAEMGIQGTVYINFVVEKDGSLTNINVVRSPDRSLSDEAVRILKTSPKWGPAQMRGRSVRQRYDFSVQFKLGDR